MKKNPSINKYLIPWIIACAFFMEGLDSTIISTAVPQIARHLHINPIDLKVALTSYLISLAIFIPISGWVADKYGARKTFTFAISTFVVGSACAGIANSLLMLVIARLLQGFGGAMMVPVGRLILLRSFPKSELVNATNYVTIPALLGPSLGPLLGGAITNYLSWRWIFYINLPVGIIGLILANKYLVNYKSSHHKPLDVWGFVWFGLALAGLEFGLEILGENDIIGSIKLTVVLFAVSCLLVYFWHSRKSKYPILDLQLFKINTFRVTVIGSFISRLGANSLPFILPLLFQIGFGVNPLISGLLTFPLAIGMIVMKLYVKRIVKKFGFRKTLVVNTALVGISIASFSFLTATTSFIWMVLLVFIQGLLSSLQFSCMNIVSYVDLKEAVLSKGISIGSTIQQLANSFGIAISALFLKLFLGPSQLSNPHKILAFHYTFIVMGVLTFISTLIFMQLNKDAGAEARG